MTHFVTCHKNYDASHILRMFLKENGLFALSCTILQKNLKIWDNCLPSDEFITPFSILSERWINIPICIPICSLMKMLMFEHDENSIFMVEDRAPRKNPSH